MPQPNPIAFTIFNMDIMWYGIIITCGMVIAAVIVYLRAPRHNLSGDNMLTLAIIVVPAGVIGARAYYVLFNWDIYKGDIAHILNFRGGGLAIHGGLILGIIAGLIVCLVMKQHPLNVMDLCAPALALAQAIGRWGNYFNSEAHGGLTDLPWGVVIDGHTYHPTFLYESIWCFILFFILLYVDNHRKFQGQVLLLYGVLYSAERVMVESLRTDSLMIGPFKQAQVISLVIIIVCVIFYVILRKKQIRRS